MEGMRRRNSGPGVHRGREATCPAVPRAVQQREQADQLSGEARGRVSVWNRQKLGLPPPPDAPELPHVPQEGGDPLCDDTAGVVLVLCVSCPVVPGPGKGLLEPSQGGFGVLHRVFVLPRGKKLLLPTARHQPHCTSPRQGEPGLLATFKDKFSSSCKLLLSPPRRNQAACQTYRNSPSQACISERKGSEGILARLENEPCLAGPGEADPCSRCL